MRLEDWESYVFDWASARRAEARSPGRAFVLGLNGPQGCGKTTLAAALVARFTAAGVRAVAVSIDDFYLTRAEQVALAARHAGCRLLAERGHAGTHDVALGTETLRTLRHLRPGETARVPVYDKSAHAGRGDRLPPAAWRTVAGPVDVVVFEGWMLGFRAVAETELPEVELRPVNASLPAYEPWTAELDALIQLRTNDPRTIRAWRAEAEERVRRAGRPAMNEAEVHAYMDAFLPAYGVYPARLAAVPPTPGRFLSVMLGPDRLPSAALDPVR